MYFRSIANIDYCRLYTYYWMPWQCYGYILSESAENPGFETWSSSFSAFFKWENPGFDPW